MAGPDLDSLPTNIDATYPDSGSDATVALHQQHHDLNGELFRAVPVEVEASTTYTLVLADAGKTKEFDNASAGTWTIPPNSSVAFPVGTVVYLRQVGAGTLTIAGGSGVTLRSRGSLVDLAGQWAEASVQQRAADEWVLTGDLT